MSSARAFERFAHGGELRGGSIGERLRREPLARGGLLHLQAVLVHARDEQGLAPVQPHESLDRIGRDAFVGMPDVRRAVGVGDRGGDVETLAHARRPRAFSQRLENADLGSRIRAPRRLERSPRKSPARAASSRLSASVSRVAARIRPTTRRSPRARRGDDAVLGRARRASRRARDGTPRRRSAAAASTASASLWTPRRSASWQVARCVEFDQRADSRPLRIEPRKRLAHRSVARRAASATSSGAGRAPGRPEPGDDLADLGRRERPRAEPPAARTDGRQHLPRPVRDDQDQRTRRRLLDHLQQRIGAGAIEIVGAVDDGDAPAAEAPPTCWKTPKRARTSSTRISREEVLRFGIPLAPEQREIGMRHRGELPRRRMIGRRREVARLAHARAARSGWASTKRAKRQASVALPIPSRPPISQACARRPFR